MTRKEDIGRSIHDLKNAIVSLYGAYSLVLTKCPNCSKLVTTAAREELVRTRALIFELVDLLYDDNGDLRTDDD